MEEKNFNDFLIIRALNEENNDFVITLGDHLASPKHYTSYEEADNVIKSTDWSIVASIAVCLINYYKDLKQSEKQEEEK